jgi:hypothetical protein
VDPLPCEQRSSEQALKKIASIHGYDLSISRGDEDTVEFDSPPWNFLVTVDVLEIDPVFDPPTPAYGSNHETESDSDDKEEGVLSPFLRVLDSRRLGVARPTVVPDLWKNSVDSLLQDYTANLDSPSPFYEHGRQSKFSARHDDPTNALRPSVSPSFRVALAGAKSTGKSTCPRF